VNGYKELRLRAFGGFASTPKRFLLAYPNAFGVGDGPLRERRVELVTAVPRRGILKFRRRFRAPQNAAVHAIYGQAGISALRKRFICFPRRSRDA